MKQNKKVLALALAFVLTIIGTVGMTVAYLTDTDNEENTFTVGNVQIELIEQQRGEDENGDKILVEFENEKVLLPIVGSAQGEDDEFGLPTAANYVDKLVTVENTGASDAYIRVFVAVPHNLDDGAEEYNAAKNVLHFNLGNKKVGDEWVTTYNTDWMWTKALDSDDWNAYETDISVKLPEADSAQPIKYTVYVGTYLPVVESGKITTRAIDGFYLDEAVDCSVAEDGTFKWTKGSAVVDYPLEKGVVIPVFAQAVQADGFADAFAAFDAAKLANPWQ